MFRHDLAHTGESTSVPTVAASVQLWNYSTGNAIASSPAIVDGYLYIGVLMELHIVLTL